MRRSLRLQALTVRAVAAGCVAALLGGLLQLSPQPLTDLLLRWDLGPPTQRPVLLVVMDHGATSGAYLRLAAQLQQGGTAAMALLDDDLPDLGDPRILQLSSPASALDEVGLQPDWDGRYRRWDPDLAGHPSLPARLLAAAGQPVPEGPQRLGIQSGGVPTLNQRQIAGLSSAAIAGRIAVVGSQDPWDSPQVEAPGGSYSLAEAVARATAGPDLPLLSPAVAAVLAGLLALGATLSLLLVRTNAARAVFLGCCGVAGLLLTALSLRLGAVIPVEVLLAGLASAGFTWRATTWQNVELQLQRLQDNLLVRLGEGVELAEAPVESTWKDLCRAAVTWGGAEAAWVFQRRGRDLEPRGRAGRVEGVQVEGLTTLLAAQVHAAPIEPIPLRGEDGARSGLYALALRAPGSVPGLLVVRPRPDEAARAGADPPVLATPVHPSLQVFADHAGVRLARGRSRAALKHVVSEQGLRARMLELSLSLDHLLDQRDLLLASHQDSRTAHALYDPLGRPLLVDEGFRQVLEGLRVAPEADIATVWEGLHLPPEPLHQILAGHAPVRASLSLPGVGMDCWIYPCAYQNRIMGVGIELTDVSELQAQDTVKSGLLEMISYRVHNILAAIRGYADLLAVGAVEATEVAPRIAARCGEMAEIFDRYEDVARSVPGGVPEPIQIIDLLQEVVAGARRTLGEHRVRLVNTPVALAPALAHRTDLARALMSLIQELSRDSTHQQAVLVELQAPAGAVEIIVRTEGHAAPLSVLQRLATDAREQGSSLANRLVTAMQGAFVVESGGETGARYRIRLREA